MSDGVIILRCLAFYGCCHTRYAANIYAEMIRHAVDGRYAAFCCRWLLRYFADTSRITR